MYSSCGFVPPPRRTTPPPRPAPRHPEVPPCSAAAVPPCCPPSASPPPPPACGPASAARPRGRPRVPTPDHVMVVVMENHAYSQVIGSSSAPYINSLKAGGANLSQSLRHHPPQPAELLRAVLRLHPGRHRRRLRHARLQLRRQPRLRGDRGGQDVGAATTRRCPARVPRPATAATTRRSTTRGSASPTCRPPRAKTFAQFPTDYSTLPKMSFVTPNLCSDMHDCSVSHR